MNYEHQSDIPLIALAERTPQAVFALDSGERVAVAFTATRTPQHTLACRIAAWQVEQDGSATPVDDEDGVVLVEFSHNASTADLDALGAQGIATALRDLVLGVPEAGLPALKWKAQLRAEVNIRNAIGVARASSALIDITGA